MKNGEIENGDIENGGELHDQNFNINKNGPVQAKNAPLHI
jgi:hypothetical protein